MVSVICIKNENSVNSEFDYGFVCTWIEPDPEPKPETKSV